MQIDISRSSFFPGLELIRALSRAYVSLKVPGPTQIFLASPIAIVCDEIASKNACYNPRMTNTEIENRLDILFTEERRRTAEILNLILLAEDRRLFLEKGCGSIEVWLIRTFKLSETCARQRAQAARLLRVVPEVEAKIETGELNLSTVAKTQSVLKAEEKRTGEKLTPAQKSDIIAQIENQTLAQTERKLAELFPETMEKVNQQKVRQVADDKMRVSLTLDRETYELVREVQDMISHAVPDNELAQAIRYVFAEFKKRKDPTRARRKSTRRATETVTLSAETERAVRTRDNNQCQFTDPLNGQKCLSRRQIEIDHIIEKACGGSNDIENLRCLCKAHNLHRARVKFGAYQNGQRVHH